MALALWVGMQMLLAGALMAQESTPPIGETLRGALLGHPRVQSARQATCQATFDVLQARAAYYPRLDASLSGGNKLIDKTTRADEFGGNSSPEYDGDGLNMTLSLRQQLYDWGRTSASVEIARLERSNARLRSRLTLDEQANTFFLIAFDYVLQQRLVEHFQSVGARIAKGVETVEARFKAGAGRVAEMRQAKIIELDAETALTGAERRRDIAARVLKTEFSMQPADALAAVDMFVSTRPDIPEIIAAPRSLTARVIASNIRASRAETRRLKAERKPAFYGVLAGRAWDVTEGDQCGKSVASTHPDARNIGSAFSPEYVLYGNCHTHELTANIEFSVPLYDGGANEAQRGAANARRRGLESELAAQHRQHGAESRRLQDLLLDLLTQTAEQTQRADDLEAQLDSERELQGRTRFNPLTLLNLELQLGQTKARLIGLDMQAEQARMEALRISDRLTDMLGIEIGGSGC